MADERREIGGPVKEGLSGVDQGSRKGDEGEDYTYNLREELTVLDRATVRLFRDQFDDLNLDLNGGEIHARVRLVRTFPISEAARFLIIKNREGAELGIIRDVAELDAASRKVLEEELEMNYFTAEITHVKRIAGRFHVPEWDVMTDRGPRVFEIRSSKRDIRQLGGGRVLIIDADGNRYEIPDYRKLDPVSRALIETQV